MFTGRSPGRRSCVVAARNHACPNEHGRTKRAEDERVADVSHLKDRLRWNQPAVARRARAGILDARRSVRRAVAGGRPDPSFLVIGAQRSGTTSLFRYLAQHPQVAPPLVKEVQFFSTSAFLKGQDWYRTNFPAARDLRRRADEHRAAVTFEATPYYLFHPLAASRAAATLPGVKLIALLRNPVDRAYSHYLHSVQRGIEPLTFEAALDAEPERLAGEEAKIRADERYDSDAFRSFSYFSRGVYVDQLAEWARWFPREQLLVLESETMYRDPGATYRRVIDWLGLSAWAPPGFDVFERSNTVRDALSAPTRARLERAYAPHDERLGMFLGADFSWTGGGGR